MTAGAEGSAAAVPDSDRLPEPLPQRRRRGTRCACGATTNLRPHGRYGMICGSCARKRG
ncbi:hypothetical protein [Streptomyces synnematoformans]|uniref:Uncharacterized protein n=1 Tax=Streptomyces synnematoformans TaxID=415721 RepID=A0ABN2XAQ5_9ACTN